MQREQSLAPLWQPKVRPRLGQHRALNKPLDKGTLFMRLTMAIFLALTVLAFASFDYQGLNIYNAFLGTIANFRVLMLSPQLTHFSLVEAAEGMLITLSLALLTTVIGAILALFFGLLAAQNLSSPLISGLIKGGVAFIRAVPTILWVLIFAIAAGLGSVAAVTGMAFHSVGYLVKAYAEAFEEVDSGVIEALRATGASWWQIVCQAVLPTAQSYLLSWTFVRFEINFVGALAMGAAAGAGGLGFDLFLASAHYFDLREVGFITYLVLAVALVLETITTQIKVRLRVQT
ncbi:MAG: Phosphate-import permease protein PhnE [Firmicutes bacterium]|nr:Phosphate-import permease protein PhnE [Bacillota bacterium]